MNVDMMSGGLPVAGNMDDYFIEARILESDPCNDKERDGTVSSESDVAKRGDQRVLDSFLDKLVGVDGKCGSIFETPGAEDDKTTMKNTKKTKRNFTTVEDEKIMEGISKFGKNWNIISETLEQRTPTQVRERYRRLQQKQESANLSATPLAEEEGSSDSSVIAESKRKDLDSKSQTCRGKRRQNEGVSCVSVTKKSKTLDHMENWLRNAEVESNPQSESNSLEAKNVGSDANVATMIVSGNDGNRSNNKKVELIEMKNIELDENNELEKKVRLQQLVPMTQQQQQQRREKGDGDGGGGGGGGGDDEVEGEVEGCGRGVSCGEEHLVVDDGVLCVDRRCDVEVLGEGELLCGRCLKLGGEVEGLRRELDEQRKENEELKEKYRNLISENQRRESEYRESVHVELSRLLREYEGAIRLEMRQKLAENISRLGVQSKFSIPGYAYYNLNAQFRRIEVDREAIEVGRKRLLKRRTQIEKSLGEIERQIKGEEVMDERRMKGLNQKMVQQREALMEELEQVNVMEQVYRQRSNSLKGAEVELLHVKEGLDQGIALHVKELRRIEEEDCSRWNDFPVLKRRYMLLTLLGRGGFSEVYRAYDLKELRSVACKIHQLSGCWSSEKKANYVRHATRECMIHHTLNHPRVVSLYDHFSVDKDTFCTVMQFCEGGDLDSRLKQQRVITENEARIIMSQIVQGLQYLSNNKIIHYDLKPANILFDKEGSIKIADFGLSKMLDPDSDKIELTSQGAGTYWYLPPECFVREDPQITSKVDVWSAGVVLYQMLFGCKPFGNEYSQKGILENNLIHPDLEVGFPERQAGKRVSDDVKSFLQKCLTASEAKRPDITTLARDPWLILSSKKCKNLAISTSPSQSNHASSSTTFSQAGFAAISPSGLLMSGGTIKLK